MTSSTHHKGDHLKITRGNHSNSQTSVKTVEVNMSVENALHLGNRVINITTLRPYVCHQTKKMHILDICSESNDELCVASIDDSDLNTDEWTETINVNDVHVLVNFQLDTDEKLICPFDSKRLNVGAGYQTLADNIKKFHEIRLMPEGIYVCIEKLDEGSGIAQSFIDHRACWHKSCNLKLNRTKLNGAEKRTSHERIIDIATTSKKKTRHSFSV
ncbi:unnamed protein product [Mytilus coruscus]|uniref:Uncharacterized protein n=1 Tax=Mytilus coruscus TaxID=42192 RepID=A0A6J7ZWT8_MYTCO|nr:unnamed protein product [Mytilus coruscus]